jgi:hypothetical protein
MIEMIFFCFIILFILNLIINSQFIKYVPNVFYNILNKQSNTILRNTILNEDLISTEWIHNEK